jgi:hypothetical protein
MNAQTDPPEEWPCSRGCSWTPERRQEWLGHRVEVSQVAAACWLGLHEHRIESLQAQLDSMSVVKRRTRVPATGTDGMILKLLDEQRLVGPWTVVPEDTK